MTQTSAGGESVLQILSQWLVCRGKLLVFDGKGHKVVRAIKFRFSQGALEMVLD